MDAQGVQQRSLPGLAEVIALDVLVGGLQCVNALLLPLVAHPLDVGHGEPLAGAVLLLILLAQPADQQQNDLRGKSHVIVQLQQGGGLGVGQLAAQDLLHLLEQGGEGTALILQLADDVGSGVFRGLIRLGQRLLLLGEDGAAGQTELVELGQGGIQLTPVPVQGTSGGSGVIFPLIAQEIEVEQSGVSAAGGDQPVGGGGVDGKGTYIQFKMLNSHSCAS